MILVLIQIINALINVLVLLVIVAVVLSFVMDPYHPVRRGIDNIIEPLLTPIRRIIPPAGMLDFSPMILILLLQFLARFLSAFLNTLR